MKIRTFVSFDYFSCNMYVVSTETTNFVVDPGYFDNKVKQYIDSIGGIKFILITHGHYDHIGGLDKFKENYPDIKVFAYSEELDIIYTNRKNLACMCSDRGKDFRSYVPTTNVEALNEGKYDLDGLSFDVIHTPGHTKGGVMFFFKEDKTIFMGDTIICESIGRCDLPSASEREMEKSLIKIKSLNIPEEVACYFGHGPMFTYSKLIKMNTYLKNA